MHTAISADLVNGACGGGGGSATVDRQTGNAAPPDSWRQWCRLCAKDDPQGNINVFFKDEQLAGGGGVLPSTNGADLSLTTAIGKYFWVNITRDEELPKMLCTECFSLVTSLVNFAERVGKVQQMFSTLQGVKDGEPTDLYTVRLHYGLLDEQREHVLMQQALPEVHYFETKPKLNELEEKMFELEATSVAVNSAAPATENPLEQSRVRIKIKKEHVLEDGANMLGAAQAPDDDDDEEEEEAVDPFNGADGDESDIADDDADAEADCDDDVDGVDDDDDDDEDDSEQEFIATKLTSSSSDGETEDDEQIDTTPKQKRQKAANNAKQVYRSLTPSPPKQRISQRKRKGTKETGAAKSPKNNADDVGLDDNGNDHNGNANNDEDGRGGGAAAIFACTECPRRFKRVQHCRQHMKRTHAKSGPLHMVACEQCTRVFSTQNQLERHVKVHLPLQLKKVLPCPYCEKRFTSNTLVQTHIKYIHMNERPFICEECGVAVRTNAALKTHMLTHSDYAPFVCEVCQKGFKHQNRLKNHMETHDPTKHICAECGLQLNSRATLNRHLLVHSDAMQHKCDYCGRAFKRAKALKNHLILHTGLKPYSCDFCERTFANGSNCRSHKKKAHPEELAALEAAGGGKTYTRNIPKLEALKAVTKVADNLAPVVSKQSGRFAFGKKPKPPAATVAAKDAKTSHKIKSAEAEAAASTTSTIGVCGPDVNSQPAMVMAIAHSNVVAAAAAAIPAIDNIYNHIMKQATLAAQNVNALEAAKSTLDGVPLHIKRSPSAASSSSCLAIDSEQLQQQQALSSGLQQHLQLQQQLQQQDQQHQLQQHALLAVQSLQQQQQPHQHLQQQQRQVEPLSALRSPDSQASSHMTDDQSNGSTQFYSHISRNMQGPFM